MNRLIDPGARLHYYFLHVLAGFNWYESTVGTPSLYLPLLALSLTKAPAVFSQFPAAKSCHALKTGRELNYRCELCARSLPGFAGALLPATSGPRTTAVHASHLVRQSLAAIRSVEKHFHEWSAELQIPRLRSG
jgi:hypothetical protein